MEKIHIIPIYDLEEHEESEKCWCRPQVKQEEEIIIIHNSLDRREVYENMVVQ